eukprot:1357896-Rhodomonas_salina.1
MSYAAATTRPVLAHGYFDGVFCTRGLGRVLTCTVCFVPGISDYYESLLVPEDLQVCSAMRLRACYAMRGTEVPYGTAR